jgi:hypothetical protein
MSWPGSALSRHVARRSSGEAVPVNPTDDRSGSCRNRTGTPDALATAAYVDRSGAAHTTFDRRSAGSFAFSRTPRIASRMSRSHPSAAVNFSSPLLKNRSRAPLQVQGKSSVIV